MRALQIAIGLACTFFFLALALYRVPVATVGEALAAVDPVWVGAAMLAYAATLLLRARRWQIILRPVAVVPYPTVARALVVGYGLNAIMPARLGELFRAEFFKKTYGLSRVWALTSIVIERLFDGVAVIACLGVGLLLATVARKGSGILLEILATGGILFGLLLLAAVCLAGPAAPRLFARFSGLAAQLGMVQRGFAILRTWRIVEVAALTVIVYLPEMLSLWLLVKSLGAALGFGDTLVLVGAASLSTLAPSGPAFLGALQLAYALALEFAGYPRALGIAAATLAQLCLLLPIALAAAGVLVHGSRSLLRPILAKDQAQTEE